MSKIKEILANAQQRSLEYPSEKWRYYQEWRRALFLHWEVSIQDLAKLIPTNLQIDTYKDKAYISLVAFSMKNTRPRNWPAWQLVSEFDEINIRTYIKNQGIPGVYFLSIEAGKKLSAKIARILSGLPYQAANIFRTNTEYSSRNSLKSFHLDTTFQVGREIVNKSALDKWLIERYYLYFDKGSELYRYQIHHPEWEINEIKIQNLDLKYQFGDLKLSNNPVLSHFSNGVEVVAWSKVKVK